MTALIALVVAALAAKLVLPTFNAFFAKQIELDLLGDPLLWVGLLGLSVMTGILAGLYPAVYLSSFQPVDTLKGNFSSGSTGKRVRKGLVIAQFAISIVLIVGTVVIYQQMQYLMDKDLGFDTEQMVIVPVFEIDSDKSWEGGRLTDRYEAVKQAFLDHPNVLEATAYRWWLGWGSGLSRTVQVEGHEGTDWRIGVLEVDDDFIDAFRIEMVAGRAFDLDRFSTDSTSAFILNESAVRAFGWDDPATGGPIGKQFKWVDRDKAGYIVGVVRDFHYSPLRDRIGPVAMSLHTTMFYNLGMRIRAEGTDDTIAHFKRLWEAFSADSGTTPPFFHSFYDQQFEMMYEAERRVQTLTILASGIAILLACMGLFGLASFAMAERRKEIGVRKTLGSSVSSVVLLVSREFMIMVAIAAAIAAPVGWRVMNGWLESFAYRTTIGPSAFVIGALAAMLIAQLTVTFHAVRAARMDPVKALRYE